MLTKYPIVKVKTSDGMTLEGLLMEPEENPSKSIVINIHGTAGSFYCEQSYPELTGKMVEAGSAILLTNNRGNHIYEIEIDTISHGSALEKFEDCLLDIDAWIEFAKSCGYTKIILSGHSFGTEKVTYYSNKGKYRDDISGVILLGFSDTVGTQQRYENSIGKNYMEEAKQLVSENKGEWLLEDLYGQAGELPMSASTYVNFFSDGSVLGEVLPFRNGQELEYIRNIRVPILGVISDDEGEYTIIPIKDAIELMKRENSLVEVKQIVECSHAFTGKEIEMAEVVAEFVKKVIS